MSGQVQHLRPHIPDGYILPATVNRALYALLFPLHVDATGYVPSPSPSRQGCLDTGR
jgi:hypothetical protein